MVVSRNYAYFSPKEYLELEQMSNIKHEYSQGKVYVMAQKSDAHVTIMGNLLTLLRSYLRGKNCRVYFADMKVRIESADVFYYPDIMITCDARDRDSIYFKRYPRLIVEVLSSSTEKFDREGKFNDYKQADSLEEYVLISQDKIRVECWRKNDDGDWVEQIYQKGEEVELTSVNFSCDIEQLYEDVF